MIQRLSIKNYAIIEQLEIDFSKGLTILTADATGAVVRTTREIHSSALEAELAALERTEGVIEVIVEPLD